MAIVRRTVGKETDPKRLEEMKVQIEAAAKRPYTYDPDCPLLTEEQLAEFRPVNFDSMEERSRYMRNQDATEAESRLLQGTQIQYG